MYLYVLSTILRLKSRTQLCLSIQAMQQNKHIQVETLKIKNTLSYFLKSEVPMYGHYTHYPDTQLNTVGHQRSFSKIFMFILKYFLLSISLLLISIIINLNNIKTVVKSHSLYKSPLKSKQLLFKHIKPIVIQRGEQLLFITLFLP